MQNQIDCNAGKSKNINGNAEHDHKVDIAVEPQSDNLVCMLPAVHQVAWKQSPFQKQAEGCTLLLLQITVGCDVTQKLE